MKILQIFNPYLNYGGEESAVAQISGELEKGHELRNVIFDIHDWAKNSGTLARAEQFLSMARNPDSIKRVKKEIAGFAPDVILLHNIMPMGSAALYYYLSHCGIPTVHYIHNFRPFSVNGYCWGNGGIIPDGLYGNFLPEIAAGAWQGSRIKTAWYGLLIWCLHRLGVFGRISGWIAISRFMKDSFVKGGIPEEKIRVIAHSWQSAECKPPRECQTSDGSDPTFLFLGRVSEEKGLLVLLDAWEMHEAEGHPGRLKIAGDGPLADVVRKRCSQLDRADYLGFTEGDAKDRLLAECTALIVPSVWWEPLGLVLYEAYDHAKPVLAARSGGIVDHVTDGVTGWIHEPGDAAELAGHLREASANPGECRRRGENGQQLVSLRDPKSWLDAFDEFVTGIIDEAKPAEFGETAGRSAEPMRIRFYLADQNPGYDRSFGISRMSQMILNSLRKADDNVVEAIVSTSSQRIPPYIGEEITLPWGTRRKWIRLISDHLHPLFTAGRSDPDIYYFPKGYLPFLDVFCHPSVVTIHDTIIQYDRDRYPEWRPSWDYDYWQRILRHTLRNADRILTVSELSKRHIVDFMTHHGIPPKDVIVTYEPCAYEPLPQPDGGEKGSHVIHLASVEPHKRTAQLVRWWLDAEASGHRLPYLQLIGTVPGDLLDAISISRTITTRPFLDDGLLQETYRTSRALLLPSEIEGFGLPALEAYYLGTPVCFVKGTSVEEILAGATSKGGYELDDSDSFFAALEEVMAMGPEEVRTCGLSLRDTFASEKVASRILEVFREVKDSYRVGEMPVIRPVSEAS